ncbi:MAG: transposase [Gaiellaceae bacterium]
MSRPSKYPKELIERGVRLALESERPIAHVAADLGIHPETLRKRVRQAEAEPLRESCRLHALRGWSHVKHIEEVFAGGS